MREHGDVSWLFGVRCRLAHRRHHGSMPPTQAYSLLRAKRSRRGSDAAINEHATLDPSRLVPTLRAPRECQQAHRPIRHTDADAPGSADTSAT